MLKIIYKNDNKHFGTDGDFTLEFHDTPADLDVTKFIDIFCSFLKVMGFHNNTIGEYVKYMDSIDYSFEEGLDEKMDE